jgi:hypothetical protein
MEPPESITANFIRDPAGEVAVDNIGGRIQDEEDPKACRPLAMRVTAVFGFFSINCLE